MSYRIVGIDVHKKILAVVVSDVEIDSEFHFERRWFGSNPETTASSSLKEFQGPYNHPEGVDGAKIAAL